MRPYRLPATCTIPVSSAARAEAVNKAEIAGNSTGRCIAGLSAGTGGRITAPPGHYVSHDLVVVWRWSAQANQGFQKVVAAITS
jgi:hypothetical protein